MVIFSRGYYHFTYDAFDRVSEKLYNGVVKVKYTYDKSGRLYKREDLFTGVTTTYVYDISGRVTTAKSTDGIRTTYDYDEYNRISRMVTVIEDESYTTEYTYGSNTVSGQKTGLIYGVKQNGTQSSSYSYDELIRLNRRTLNTGTPFVTTYTYLEGTGTDTTTALVKKIQNGSDTLEYTYDTHGNITSVSKNGSVVESYTYDNGGNIVRVTKNNTVIKTYSYTNSNWKDQLTWYTGKQITYDAIGNPLKWHNGMTFQWQYGRRLASITNGSNSISYSYDADGLRTSKTVNGVTTEYEWLDGTLLGQSQGNDHFVFLYDENGIIYGMLVDNGTSKTYYYYIFNLQGDVIGILNSAGTKVVEYTYDAWGALLSVTGSMAGTIGESNPIRYRGYYYDDETGFYYLNSRFYDTEIGRFLNADTTDILGVSNNLYDKNLYAYCDNNPVMREDKGGAFWNIAAGAIIGGTISAVTQMIGNIMVGDSLSKGVLMATVTGAASGGLSASAIGIVGQALGNAGISALGEVINQGDKLNTMDGIGSVAKSAVLGFVGGLIGGNGMRHSSSEYYKVAQSAKMTAEKVFSKNYSNSKTATKLLNRAIKKVNKVGYKESLKTGVKFFVGCGNAQIWSRWEVK